MFPNDSMLYQKQQPLPHKGTSENWEAYRAFDHRIYVAPLGRGLTEQVLC